MRKFVDKKATPEVGDTRIRRKFLLFPRRFGRDWRWLESADIIEEFCNGGWTEPCFWTEKDFADNRTKYIESIEKPQIEEAQDQTDVVVELNKNRGVSCTTHLICAKCGGDNSISNRTLLSFELASVPHSKLARLWFKCSCCNEEYDLGLLKL